MSYFNFDAYERLCEVIGKKAASKDKTAEQDIANFQKAMRTFHKYVSNVSHDTTYLDIVDARFADDPANAKFLHQLVRESITAEKKLVDAMISLVNLTAEMNGVNPIYTGDPDDLDAMSEFCLDVTREIFVRRRK